MSRKRQHRKTRGPEAGFGKEAKAGQAEFDADNVRLEERRFDTPEASRAFMNLRYLHDDFKGSTNNAVRLPAPTEPVSATPGSGGMVFKAFPHGLMYGDELSLMGGLGVFAAVPLLFLCYGFGSGIWLDFSGASLLGMFMSAVLILLGAAVAPLMLVIFLSDVMGYRFSKSALLDRQAGRVHVFTDKTVPWRGYRHEIKSYDWAQVRAEIDAMQVFTGTVGRNEVGLRCTVMSQPGGTEVIDQFPLTVNMPAHNIQPLLDTWEHARRFMQREGPLFADEHDGPNPELGQQSLWHYLLMFPRFFYGNIPGEFADAWKYKSLLHLTQALLGVVLLPVFFLPAAFGVFPWISARCKREPKWPAEILASVGGNALKGSDLQAWRGMVPQRVEDDASATPTLP